MKTSGQCLKCNSLDLVHFSSVSDADSKFPPNQEMVLQRGWFSTVGKLEAYACNQCGYVEFYVKDLPLPHKVSDGARMPDVAVNSAWELNRLIKRVATLEHLATVSGHEATAAQSSLDATNTTPVEFQHQTVDLLKKFLGSTIDDAQRTTALELLEKVNNLSTSAPNVRS